jgi:hypothetical protein
MCLLCGTNRVYISQKTTFTEYLKVTFIVRFEVFTAVTMKNGVFWVVTPCGSWYFFAAYVGC